MFNDFIQQNKDKKKKKSTEQVALEWLNQHVFDRKFPIYDSVGGYGIVEYKYIRAWELRILYKFELFGFMFFDVYLNWSKKGTLIAKKSESPENLKNVLERFIKILGRHKLAEPFIRGVIDDKN